MAVNREKNIGFVHIPRTGGTTVEHLMGIHKDRPETGFGASSKQIADLEHFFGKNLQHLGFFDMLDLLGPESRNMKWFSLIRNPEERFISIICYMLDRPESLHSTKKLLGVFKLIGKIWLRFYFQKAKFNLFSMRSGRQVNIYTPHIQHLMPQTSYFLFEGEKKKDPIPAIQLYPFSEIGNMSKHIPELDETFVGDRIPNKSTKPEPKPHIRRLIRGFTYVFYRSDWKYYHLVENSWKEKGAPFVLVFQ